MNIFIDTNIFISFYHLSSDDLEELKKLAVLLGSGSVKLFLPEQTVDEFTRNRDIKIADAVKRFEGEKLNNAFPQMCKEYDEYGLMREAIKNYEKHKAKLLAKLTDDIAKETLKADDIIGDLFSKAQQIKLTTGILARSRLRMFVGNPPGKNNSSGDAINWECLLESVPDSEDLFFITDDRDYESPSDDSDFSPFLLKEWIQQKKSKIHYFSKLSKFFKAKFPAIRLASELEKDLLIAKFASSPNFATTRKLLKNLVKYDDFTKMQLNDIVHATNVNSQITWIATDEDIKDDLCKLIRGHLGQIDADALRMFKVNLGIKKYSTTANTEGED